MPFTSPTSNKTTIKNIYYQPQELNLHQTQENDKQISELTEKINVLYNFFGIQSPNHNSMNLPSPSQEIINQKEIISLLRYRIIDLGCIILNKMAIQELYLKPDIKNKNFNIKPQSEIQKLEDLLIFLENQKNRLNKSKTKPEKSTVININLFFQNQSIEFHANPAIFTLNIYLVFLTEKFSYINNSLQFSDQEKNPDNDLKKLSDTPEEMSKVLDEIEKANRKISQIEEKEKEKIRKPIWDSMLTYMNPTSSLI